MPAPPRACGDCGLCCKVMGIHELKKPPGVWCGHFKAGAGCRIYGERPGSCRAFQCLWLLSPTMPDAVRPDRTKVVLTLEDGGVSLIAQVDPDDPEAWRREPIHGQLRLWAADYWFKGRTVWVVVGDQTWLIAPDRDIALGDIGPHSFTNYKQAADGAIVVTVLPARPDGRPYDDAEMDAALAAGLGQRVVSRRP